MTLPTVHSGEADILYATTKVTLQSESVYQLQVKMLLMLFPRLAGSVCVCILQDIHKLSVMRRLFSVEKE